MTVLARVLYVSIGVFGVLGIFAAHAYQRILVLESLTREMAAQSYLKGCVDHVEKGQCRSQAQQWHETMKELIK